MLLVYYKNTNMYSADYLTV